MAVEKLSQACHLASENGTLAASKPFSKKEISIMDKYIAKQIILAQIASDGGKGYTETLDRIGRIVPMSEMFYKKGYHAKDGCVIKAIKAIQKKPGCGFRYHVKVDRTLWNGRHRFIVYFNFKLDGESYQISFHCFSNMWRFVSQKCVTRWKKKHCSKESVIRLALRIWKGKEKESCRKILNEKKLKREIKDKIKQFPYFDRETLVTGDKIVEVFNKVTGYRGSGVGLIYANKERTHIVSKISDYEVEMTGRFWDETYYIPQKFKKPIFFIGEISGYGSYYKHLKIARFVTLKRGPKIKAKSGH